MQANNARGKGQKGNGDGETLALVCLHTAALPASPSRLMHITAACACPSRVPIYLSSRPYRGILSVRGNLCVSFVARTALLQEAIKLGVQFSKSVGDAWIKAIQVWQHCTSRNISSEYGCTLVRLCRKRLLLETVLSFACAGTRLCLTDRIVICRRAGWTVALTQCTTRISTTLHRNFSILECAQGFAQLSRSYIPQHAYIHPPAIITSRVWTTRRTTRCSTSLCCS